MNERWLPVPGYEDYYEVSDLGRVRSLARTCRHPKGGTRIVPARVRKLNVAEVRKNVGTHRLFIQLNKGGVRYRHSVHFLVLTAFRGPRPTPEHQCRHLNCDASDNRLVNLQWGTAEENYADSRRLNHQPRGEQIGTSKLTADQVRKNRERYASGMIGRVLSEQFGVSRNLIYAIVNREIWTHV